VTPVHALRPAELAGRLARGTLRLRTGPFVMAIASPLDEVAAGITSQYPDHPVEDEAAFVDFAVRVDRPPGLRRWYRPQVLFTVDGQTPFTPLPGNQGFALLEWGMNWCITAQCHQYLTLHAAVLERGGRAIVMPAPSGSGKSTLCAGLAHRGWRLLSDELALIDFARGHLTPVPRPISLKNASIEVIRQFAPDAHFSAVCADTLKGSVAHCRAPGAAVALADVAARPGWIVLPRYEAGAPTQLTPLPKARAVLKLVEAAFNFNVHRHAAFDALCRLVDASDCFEFRYSRLDEATRLLGELAATAGPSADAPTTEGDDAR